LWGAWRCGPKRGIKRLERGFNDQAALLAREKGKNGHGNRPPKKKSMEKMRKRIMRKRGGLKKGDIAGRRYTGNRRKTSYGKGGVKGIVPGQGGRLAWRHYYNRWGSRKGGNSRKVIQKGKVDTVA